MGCFRPQPLLGWRKQAGADTSLEQDKVSAILMLLLTFVCGQIIAVSRHEGFTGLGVPGCVGTEACPVLMEEVFWHCELLLQNVNLLGQEAGKPLPSDLFSGVPATAPEQLLYVNSFVLCQFCRITSRLYRLGQSISASVSGLGFPLCLFFFFLKKTLYRNPIVFFSSL